MNASSIGPGNTTQENTIARTSDPISPSGNSKTNHEEDCLVFSFEETVEEAENRDKESEEPFSDNEKIENSK